MNNDQKSDIRKVFKHFGFTNQYEKMIEEFEEYKQAINNYLSDPTEENLNNIIFEASDLSIMVEQMMYGTINIKSDMKPANIDVIRQNSDNYKIKRTLERIENRYYEGGK